MQRGTLVRVNQNCRASHLIGTEGIVLSKNRRNGFFQTYLLAKGATLWFPPRELDVLEGAIEL